MMGFTWPVDPDLRWSVHRGRLEAFTVFGPILESSRFSLSLYHGVLGSEVNVAQVGSWRCCFVMPWLGDDFLPHGMIWWMG
jgi:hypothetical protein